MAQLGTYGLGELELSLREIMRLPDSVALEMLTAEGEVFRAAQVRSVQETFSPERSHQLEASITVSKELKRGKSGPYVTVYPKGTRRKKKGEKEGTRNAEVGFIGEFGAPGRGLDATQWMRKANESAADRAVQAAAQVYDRWLGSKGL